MRRSCNHRIRYAATLLIAPLLLSAACLSAAKHSATITPTPNRAGTAAAAQAAGAGTPASGATIISQPQPGANGTLMAGVITLNGDPPPSGSTLFLGLVTSATDTNPRTCIDAQRNPVNDQGQFYAQVACKPQPGDQLYYVLIIGPAGDRNWRRGVITMPADLSNFQIQAS